MGNIAVKIVGAVAGGVVAPFLAPAALGLVGFGAAGPVAGTLAALWQSSVGNVVAGSVFTVLQSAAMGGTGATVVGVVSAATGAVVGAAAAGGSDSDAGPNEIDDDSEDAPDEVGTPDTLVDDATDLTVMNDEDIPLAISDRSEEKED